MCNKMHSLVYQGVVEEKMEGCGGGGEEFVKRRGQFSTHKKDNNSTGWGRGEQR